MWQPKSGWDLRTVVLVAFLTFVRWCTAFDEYKAVLELRVVGWKAFVAKTQRYFFCFHVIAGLLYAHAIYDTCAGFYEGALNQRALVSSVFYVHIQLVGYILGYRILNAAIACLVNTEVTTLRARAQRQVWSYISQVAVSLVFRACMPPCDATPCDRSELPGSDESEFIGHLAVTAKVLGYLTGFNAFEPTFRGLWQVYNWLATGGVHSMFESGKRYVATMRARYFPSRGMRGLLDRLPHNGWGLGYHRRQLYYNCIAGFLVSVLTFIVVRREVRRSNKPRVCITPAEGPGAYLAALAYKRKKSRQNKQGKWYDIYDTENGWVVYDRDEDSLWRYDYGKHSEWMILDDFGLDGVFEDDGWEDYKRDGEKKKDYRRRIDPDINAAARAEPTLAFTAPNVIKASDLVQVVVGTEDGFVNGHIAGGHLIYSAHVHGGDLVGDTVELKDLHVYKAGDEWGKPTCVVPKEEIRLNDFDTASVRVKGALSSFGSMRKSMFTDTSNIAYPTAAMVVGMRYNANTNKFEQYSHVGEITGEVRRNFQVNGKTQNVKFLQAKIAVQPGDCGSLLISKTDDGGNRIVGYTMYLFPGDRPNEFISCADYNLLAKAARNGQKVTSEEKLSYVGVAPAPKAGNGSAQTA